MVAHTPLPHMSPSPGAVGAALQKAPTYGQQGHPLATHGTDVFGRLWAQASVQSQTGPSLLTQGGSIKLSGRRNDEILRES